MLNVHSSSGALLKAKLIISFNNKLGMYLSRGTTKVRNSGLGPDPDQSAKNGPE